MMIKQMVIGLALLLLTTASHSQTLSIELRKLFTSKSNISRVRFSTGEQLLLLKPGREGSNVSFELLTREKRRHILSNDGGAISLAIPNKDNALIAVFSDSCAGTACGTEHVSVAVVVGDKVQISDLGEIAYSNDKAKLDISISGTATPLLVAKNIDAGRNELGDNLFADMNFVPGVGFVDFRFRGDIKPLINNPLSFFGDENLRKPLVSKIGVEKFRQLRDALALNTESGLKQGRYLVSTGCRPHLCNAIQGSIVIDGVTGGVWVAYADSFNKDYWLGGFPAATYEIGNDIRDYLGLPNMKVDYVDGKLVGFSR